MESCEQKNSESVLPLLSPALVDDEFEPNSKISNRKVQLSTIPLKSNSQGMHFEILKVKS